MMTQLRKNIQWREPVQTFARADIHPMGKFIKHGFVADGFFPIEDASIKYGLRIMG
jgi:hypothetical protein